MSLKDLIWCGVVLGLLFIIGLSRFFQGGFLTVLAVFYFGCSLLSVYVIEQRKKKLR